MNRRPRTRICDAVILSLLALLCVVASFQFVISARRQVGKISDWPEQAKSAAI